MKKFSPYLQFKILLFISILYITIDFASNLMLYKIVNFGVAILPAGIVIYPMVFILGDIIAELYGYKIARLIVIYDLVFNFIFASILYCLVKIPSPSYWTLSKAYTQVLGKLLEVNSIVTIAILIGSLINVYFINKWKIMTHGRYFWLRSIGSSAIGSAITLVLAVLLLYTGKLSLSDMFKLIEFDYLFRLLYAIIGSFPANIAVNYLKNKGVDNMFSAQLNFNPFIKYEKDNFIDKTTAN